MRYNADNAKKHEIISNMQFFKSTESKSDLGTFYFFVCLFVYLLWRIVDLQCCVSFKCTGKWFSFWILFHYWLLRDIEYSSLCYTVGPCCLSILYIVVCICLSQTPNLFLPLKLLNLHVKEAPLMILKHTTSLEPLE